MQSRKIFFSAVLLAAAIGAQAQPSCGARVTVRQVAMQPNDDGTRTLKYRASVQVDSEGAACTRVKFSVMRSYVKRDGSTVEAGIPVTVDVPRHNADVEGDDVLPTSRLVYWWPDQVRCEPCPAAATSEASPAVPGKAKASAPQASADDSSGASHPKHRKKAALTLGAVAMGALLLL